MRKVVAQEILKYVAEHSTIEQRDQIRLRNQALLTYLEAHPPEKLTQDETYVVTRGCPHCVYCNVCTWERACQEVLQVKRSSEACFYVPFRGITLHSVTCGIYYRIFYHKHDAVVVISKPQYTDTAMTKRILTYYHRCLRFVRGHIDWTNTFEWGKYVNQGAAEQNTVVPSSVS